MSSDPRDGPFEAKVRMNEDGELEVRVGLPSHMMSESDDLLQRFQHAVLCVEGAYEVQDKEESAIEKTRAPLALEGEEGWVAFSDDECLDATEVCVTPEDAVAEWFSEGGLERLVGHMGEEEVMAIGDLTLWTCEAKRPSRIFQGHQEHVTERALEWAEEDFEGAGDRLRVLERSGESLDQLGVDIEQALLRHLKRCTGSLKAGYWVAGEGGGQIIIPRERVVPELKKNGLWPEEES